MSKEFEKIVLEKLDKIDSTLNEHTEQFKKVRKDTYEINNKIIKSLEKMQEIEEVVEFNTQYIKKYHEEDGKKMMLHLKHVNS